jgi:hypothetical protein
VFALVVSLVIIPSIGLVVDGGYALAQRRASQNASDFAALAGARIVAERVSGNTTDGTDANVQAAITLSIAVNGGTPPSYGPPGGPRYVNASGSAVGYVGGGSIPANAVGVVVGSSRSWTPFFVGALVGTWTASATATARGGYSAGGPGSGVFPVGIAEAFFNSVSGSRSPCSGPVTTNVNGSGPCDPQHLTPGVINVPGGFGWLKFGCDGYGLGQVPPANNDGCLNKQPFLQTEIGHSGGVSDPTPGSSFGCCTQTGLPGSLDRIGSLPGNKASAQCDWYIDKKVTVIVPVWDYGVLQGSNSYYHIVGFTGWQLTKCDSGKAIEGVWRQPFVTGPTTTTPGFAGAPLAVQLIH